MAQAGNTEAILTWQAPAASSPDHGQPVLHYEYRVKVGTGSFSSWAAIPNSDGDTRSHRFTGLANDTLHTYEVAAVNVAGRGAVAQETVTPIEGIAVSFGAAALSVDEGGSASVTLTLGEAPAAGTTVTVPISDAPGAGLDSNEYSGVPSSVTFNAGQTSRSFTVATVDDSDDEPDRTLTLSLGMLAGRLRARRERRAGADDRGQRRADRVGDVRCSDGAGAGRHVGPGDGSPEPGAGARGGAVDRGGAGRGPDGRTSTRACRRT